MPKGRGGYGWIGYGFDMDGGFGVLGFYFFCCCDAVILADDGSIWVDQRWRKRWSSGGNGCVNLVATVWCGFGRGFAQQLAGFWLGLIWVFSSFFFSFFFSIWIFVPMGFWWAMGSGGMVGMVEAWWWWLGSGGAVLEVEGAWELVKPTNTSSDKLLIRNWGWVRTREKLY